MRITGVMFFGLALALGCGDSSGSKGDEAGSADSSGEGSDTGSATQSGTGSDADGEESESGDDGAKFDVAPEDMGGGGGDICKVNDEMDGIGNCEQTAPPDSFEPAVQWEWTGNPDKFSIVTPMVANLTDDNDDGKIDLCDVPDVVVVAYPATSQPGHIYVLDGETGSLHFQIEEEVAWGCNPALGDIDGDGEVEIVAFDADSVKAFDTDGTQLWDTADGWGHVLGAAVALADLDADGDVEIVLKDVVYDHEGNLLQQFSGYWPLVSATAVADIDGDEDQEIIGHASAHHHDGGTIWAHNDLGSWGYPQVANLDDDPEPEILVQANDGITIMNHDGSFIFKNEKTTNDGPGNPWLRPSTVHDFDGDGVAEFAASTGDLYIVYENDLSIIWTAPVDDSSGDATGTAFDFLGSGKAQAMYADEHNLHIYDGDGIPLLTQPRRSITHIEYPVVADIDNDGSAEIVVVSNSYLGNEEPTVKVIRDAEDRWIQARRIWNQHTYHVTNVREDGTIPTVEIPSWEALNTYRTNAQIEGGSVCEPEG